MARLGAGVRKRADGTLEKRFTIEGKRYSVYGSTFKELTRKEMELRKTIEKGLYVDNRNITMNKYYEEWINQKDSSVRPSTIRNYKSFYKLHIGPAFGKKKICSIERREVIAFQDKLTEKKAPSSVKSIMRVLNIILNDAIRDEIIAKNPAALVKCVRDDREKATETYHRALTEEEQKSFMEEMKNDFYYYEFVAFLLCSGMRFGEAAALTWTDIDYKDNVIHITKTLSIHDDNKYHVTEGAKSAAGNRDIPLTDTLKEILKKKREKDLMFNPIISIDKLIFTSEWGRMLKNSTVNDAIRGALDRLEDKGIHIEHFTAHALRDTYATRYIEQGGKPKTLQKILGHSSLKMTMDLYTHVMDETMQKEAQAIKFDIAL